MHQKLFVGHLAINVNERITRPWRPHRRRMKGKTFWRSLAFQIADAGEGQKISNWARQCLSENKMSFIRDQMTRQTIRQAFTKARLQFFFRQGRVKADSLEFWTNAQSLSSIFILVKIHTTGKCHHWIVLSYDVASILTKRKVTQLRAPWEVRPHTEAYQRTKHTKPWRRKRLPVGSVRQKPKWTKRKCVGFAFLWTFKLRLEPG